MGPTPFNMYPMAEHVQAMQTPVQRPTSWNSGVREPFWSNAYSQDYVKQNSGRHYDPYFENMMRATDDFGQSLRQARADHLGEQMAMEPFRRDQAMWAANANERSMDNNNRRQQSLLQGLFGGLAQVMQPFSMQNMQQPNYGGMGGGMKNTQFRDSQNAPVGGITRSAGRKSPMSGLL